MNEHRRTRGRKPDKIAYTGTLYFPNAIVHVNYPDISDEENERRMKLIKQAATELLKETIRNERQNAKAN